MATPEPSDTTSTDGRRARRERGRMAVIDAVIDAILATGSVPTTDEVVQAAGVSPATLFRYFDTLDELRADAITHYFDRFSHLFEIPDIGVGTHNERIAGFVDARIRQYDATCHMARLVRSRSLGGSEIDAALRRLRATQRVQVRIHFSDGFDDLAPEAAEDLTLTIATLTSFEAWDQLTSDFGRSAQQVRRAWTTALRSVIASPTDALSR